jgi:hypothetical protein
MPVYPGALRVADSPDSRPDSVTLVLGVSAAMSDQAEMPDEFYLFGLWWTQRLLAMISIQGWRISRIP